MKTKKVENQENWRQLVNEAEGYPASLAAYCRTKGISKSKFYFWRKKFQKGDSARSMTPINPFSRLEVVADSRPPLPDAQWVAEFVHHLLGAGK